MESGAAFLGAGLIGGVGEEGEGGTAVSQLMRRLAAGRSRRAWRWISMESYILWLEKKMLFGLSTSYVQ